jgi:hypothetical protein
LKRIFVKHSLLGEIKREARETKSGYNDFTVINGNEQYNGTIQKDMINAWALERKEQGFTETE